MLRGSACLLTTTLLGLCAVTGAQVSPWRYDFRAGDHLVYFYRVRKEVRSEQAETVVEARFHTQVLIAGNRDGIISAGFQRNRDSAELVSYRVKGKDKLSEEQPNFRKRMQVRPSEFSEAMEFNTIGQPRYPWEVARETPSHILPALHEVETLALNPVKPGDGWDAMNVLGMTFRLVGPESLHGKDCYHVMGSTGDGSVNLSYWWSAESRVLEQVELEGSYPVPGGTSHEHAVMELVSRTRGQSISDWLAKPETELGALEALLLSPGLPITPEQITSSIAQGKPATQRLALAVARRRGMKVDLAWNGLVSSTDSVVSVLAKDLAETDRIEVPKPLCPSGSSRKPEPAKYGTLFRAASPVKQAPAIPYFLRIPTSYRGDRATPLLVYLSGGPGLALDGVNTANDAVALTDYLILYPQAGEHWWKPEVAVRLDSVLRDVFRDFNIDRDRVYLAGFSNGGTGALYMAELWPQRFAAVVSLMGAGQCMEEVRGMLPNLVSVPLYFVHGEKDGRISPTCSQTTFDALRELRPQVAPELRLLPDRDHDITLVSDDGLTLQFLRDKIRNAFPKRINARISVDGFPRQYWIEVLEKKGAAAEVNAEIKQGNVIEIRSRDVTRLRLYLRPEMSSPQASVKVRWNGRQVLDKTLQDTCSPVQDGTGDPKLDFSEAVDLAAP